MKTIKLATLFLSLSMILTANVALANQANLQEKAAHEKNVKSTMFQFMVLGITSACLQAGASAIGLGASPKAVLHLSNVMFQSGIIFDKPTLTDLGVRAMLASNAAAMANHPLAQNNIASLPLIGQHLKNAGAKGIAITTVAFYEMIKLGYISVVDSMPDSMQNMFRGE